MRVWETTSAQTEPPTPPNHSPMCHHPAKISCGGLRDNIDVNSPSYMHHHRSHIGGNDEELGVEPMIFLGSPSFDTMLLTTTPQKQIVGGEE